MAAPRVPTIGSTSPRATHTLQQHTHFVPPVLRVLALWLAIVRYDSGLDTSLPVPNALEVEGHVLSFSVVVRCGRTTPREPPRRVRRYRRPRRISHGPADAAVKREVLHPLAQSACLSTSARGRAVATFGGLFPFSLAASTKRHSPRLNEMRDLPLPAARASDKVPGRKYKFRVQDTAHVLLRFFSQSSNSP